MIRTTLMALAIGAVVLTSSMGGQAPPESKQAPAKNRQAAAKERRAAKEAAAKDKDAAATDKQAPAKTVQAPVKLEGCASPGGARTQGSANAANSYFEGLISRPDCAAAYSLRDQAKLDGMKTGAKGRPDKKRPVAYDADMDAARVTIFAPTSADSQQKILPLGIERGSMLLTWDFRFDENFKWRENGYVARHKTWRIDPGPWLALKTEYKTGARKGHLAQLAINVPGKKFLAAETKRKGETLVTNLAPFYFDADTWVRVWILAEDMDQPTAHVSVWAADERRDPIQLYERVALLPPKGGLAAFRIEYDTSADQGKNPNQMNSWNRNVVVLQNIPRADLAALLKRPVQAQPRRQ